MSFFAELRRRNVVKVGAAYAVTAWIIMQVTDLAAPALRLPEWVMSLVVFLLLIGFPVALFLAWAYELSPDGIRRTQQSDPMAPETAAGSRYDIAIVVLLAVAIGLIAHDNFFSQPDIAVEPVDTPQDSGPDPGPVSIAVIPFINMSDDTAQEHFADGLTEELLNSLAPLDELRVISRTSSFAFKNSELPLPDIAAQLGVENILEGSVRRAGDRIRITAQLIETNTDSHLWSRTYDRELTVDNIFEIQESIATTVVEALQLKLLPTDGGKEFPSNLEALDLYHDGLFILRAIETGETYEESAFYTAETKFQAAAAADPNWLMPVAMLGRLYHFWSAGGSDSDKLAESKRLIESVLAEDPTNPTALASLGYILSVEGRFEESLATYDRAEQAGGGNVWWGRAITLMSVGRLEEAIAAYRQAMTSDPLNNSVRAQLAMALQCAGRYEEILANEEGLLTQFGEHVEFLGLLAEAHARAGNREAAFEYVDRILAQPQEEAFLADVLALLGEEERAQRGIDELGSRNEGLQTGAVAALVLGDQEKGLHFLERIEQQTTVRGQTLWLLCDPEVRNLAGNPRYEALLAERGLPPGRSTTGQ